MTIAKFTIAAGLLLVVPVLAQVDTAAAQKKLLAKRAAEADAYRKLAEAIKGLQINSETYVRDFVAENDQIRAGMDNFIRGVRLGEPKYMSDGSAEVPAEVTVAKVIQEIKELHTRHYKGDCGRCVKAKDIVEMQQRLDKQVIKVVGMGAPREDLPPDLPEGVVKQLGGPPIPPEPPIPELWKQVGPKGRLMAKQAAEVDAKRKLVERIVGLRVTSDTLVKDFVAESDQIQTVAQGTLIGATIEKVYYHHDEPICEVTVSVPVESVITTIKTLHTRTIQGDHIKGTDISELCRSIKTQAFQATGTGIPPEPILKAYNAKVDPREQLPPWAMGSVVAKGQGVAPADKAGTPQGKLLAARAAELDAKRKLAEQVYGLRIQSNTTVKDFVAERDEIRTLVDAVLVGATIDKTTFNPDGTAEVTVSLPGMSIWDQVNGGQRVAAAAPRQ